MLDLLSDDASQSVKNDLPGVIAGGIRPVYQPIVDLERKAIVGYEALARGPVGSALEFPLALFDAARQHSLLPELDRACVLAACRGAETGLLAPAALFINVEPEVIDTQINDASLEVLRTLAERLDVFFEVTERSLTTRPAELLETVSRLRSAGFGIALDDVGADSRSLALLPLLRPDIIKLDGSLVHRHPSRRSGQILNGVGAYAESVGTTILAEGIETEAHLHAARSMGATLAQGWYFGRPGPLPPSPAANHGTRVPVRIPPRPVEKSPTDLVAQRLPLRIGSEDMLLSITRALEAQAIDLGEHAVVVAAFQDAGNFDGRTRARYAELGEITSLTVVLGDGFEKRPAPGVLGVSVPPDDPLRDEWDIAVLGPHYAGALVARDLGDDGEKARRRFEFALTFDRELVVDIAATLIAYLHA